MTSFSPSDNGLVHRLAADMTALEDSLDSVLDLEAGFAGTQLQPDPKNDLMHMLDALLDLDSGLAAVVASPPGPVVVRPKPDPAVSGSDGLHLEVFVSSLFALPPRERLAARLWLPDDAVRKIRTLADLTRQGRQLGLDLVLDLDLVSSLLGEPGSPRSRVDALTATLDRALARVQELNAVLAEALDRIRADALADNQALAEALAVAEAFAGTLNRDRRHIQLAVRSRQTDLDLDLTRAEALDLSFAIAHAQELVLADALADAGTDALTNIARIGEHRHVKGFNMFNDALTYDRERALARADELRKADVSTHEHAFDLMRLSDVSHALIDFADRLTTATTDMTSDDLSQADLSGIPLRGVRWSDGSTSMPTRWPVVWDDLVRQVSDAVSPGVWEIRAEVGLDSVARWTG